MPHFSGAMGWFPHQCGRVKSLAQIDIHSGPMRNATTAEGHPASLRAWIAADRLKPAEMLARLGRRQRIRRRTPERRRSRSPGITAESGRSGSQQRTLAGGRRPQAIKACARGRASVPPEAFGQFGRGELVHGISKVQHLDRAIALSARAGGQPRVTMDPRGSSP